MDGGKGKEGDSEVGCEDRERTKSSHVHPAPQRMLDFLQPQSARWGSITYLI